MTWALIDRALGVFWIEVLRHVWQSLLVLLPLFLIAPVLRSAPAQWSHRLWMGALAKLFVPLAVFGPLAGAFLQRLLAPGGPASHAGGIPGFQTVVTVLGVEASSSTLAGRIPAPFWLLFTLAYATIALWLLARTARDLAVARRLASAAAALTPDWQDRLDSALQVSGLSRAHIVVTGSNVIPAVVGTFRPRVVIPARLIGALDTDELAAVLLHEDVPLLAPLQRRLLEAAELRCDEGALRAGASPAAYVRALARTIQLGLEPSPAPAALGDGNPSLVAQRLERLRQPRRSKIMAKHRIAIGAAAIVLIAGVLFPVGPTRLLAGTGSAGISDLERLAAKDLRVTVKFEETSAAHVLAVLATAGRFEIALDAPENCCPITIDLEDVPLAKALEAVARSADIRYEVIDANHLHASFSGAAIATKDMTLPVIVNKVEPIYPKDARDARAQGHVVLEAVIREDGSVGSVEVIRHVEGWPSMDDAAVAAVRQWTYTPALKDGHPVSVVYHVRIDFRIGQEEAED